MRNAFLILLVLVLFSGCVPYHFTERAGALGLVVDKENNQPISDVKIQLELRNEYAEMPISEFRTKSDGTFYLPPKKKWGLYFFPMDCFPWQYDLLFSHEKYSQMKLEFQHTAIDKPDTVDFGTVTLEKK